MELEDKKQEKTLLGPKLVVNSTTSGESDDVGVVHELETEYGPLRATVHGSLCGPVFITYHDIGTNSETAFKQFFKYAPQKDCLIAKFGVVHIDAPGQFFDASVIPSAHSYLDMDKLTEQILEVVKKLSINKFVAVGAGAGGYIMLNFATKHPEFVKALILLGASSRKCGWIEWANKWWANSSWYLSGKLNWQNYFLERWFSWETIENNHRLVNTYTHEMERINQGNLYKFLQGFHRRLDITSRLAAIECPVLMFVGDNTDLYNESVHILDAMGPNADWIKERSCGLLLTVERPEAMIEPISLMLQGMGYMKEKKGTPQNEY